MIVTGLVIHNLKPVYITQDFLDTLSILRPTNLTVEEATELWIMSWQLRGVYVAVTDELPNGNPACCERVVGTATLLIEQKFIRHGGFCGHIEDVAVHPEYQGQGIGKSLVQRLIDVAKKRGCYKMILDCSEELVPFYKKVGFHESDRHMRLDIPCEPKNSGACR